MSVCTTTRLVLKVQSGTTLLSAIMCLSVQLLVVLCRYNVAQLEQWARDQKIEDSGNKVVDTLLPVIHYSGEVLESQRCSRNYVLNTYTGTVT